MATTCTRPPIWAAVIGILRSVPTTPTWSRIHLRPRDLQPLLSACVLPAVWHTLDQFNQPPRLRLLHRPDDRPPSSSPRHHPRQHRDHRRLRAGPPRPLPRTVADAVRSRGPLIDKFDPTTPGAARSLRAIPSPFGGLLPNPMKQLRYETTRLYARPQSPQWFGPVFTNLPIPAVWRCLLAVDYRHPRPNDRRGTAA